MMFVCCDDAIPRESQLVFALKTLCGFSVAEIALRLFTSDANVYKRYARAPDRLREMAPELEAPPLGALRSRLPNGVQAVLYLLFNDRSRAPSGDRTTAVFGRLVPLGRGHGRSASSGATFSGAAWRSRPDSALRRSHLQRSCECVPSSASARFEIRPVIV
jgi:hypothetical protein